MENLEINLDPVDHITVDAIGKPGERIFYIQGTKGNEIVNLIIEKIQLQSLIVGAGEFLEEIQKKYPRLENPVVDFRESEMHLNPPVDPRFRIGDLGLAYDETRDLICLIAKEMSLDDKKSEEIRVVRYWCTRAQLIALIRWGAIVAERGRPICPQCLQPMELEGHFCPKKNGHKRGKTP